MNPLGHLTKDIEAFERSLADPEARIVGCYPLVCLRGLKPDEQRLFLDAMRDRALELREAQAQQQEGDVWLQTR